VETARPLKDKPHDDDDDDDLIWHVSPRSGEACHKLPCPATLPILFSQ